MLEYLRRKSLKFQRLLSLTLEVIFRKNHSQTRSLKSLWLIQCLKVPAQGGWGRQETRLPLLWLLRLDMRPYIAHITTMWSKGVILRRISSKFYQTHSITLSRTTPFSAIHKISRNTHRSVFQSRVKSILRTRWDLRTSTRHLRSTQSTNTSRITCSIN